MISYELVQTIYLDKLLIQFRICSEKIFNVLMLVGRPLRQKQVKTRLRARFSLVL